ncbi:hypothetical protein AKJ09_00966 [Labilithrix luteola]|uniref:Uncharacterized protein n=1 Tax=Labilithrix luteola TaxID=1391654 RepID=A0A0K1PLA9_9BACT|nr:hypothetical protein AKJ09_00966 [Labilithrix luteola]
MLLRRRRRRHSLERLTLAVRTVVRELTCRRIDRRRRGRSAVRTQDRLHDGLGRILHGRASDGAAHGCRKVTYAASVATFP